MKSAKSRRVPLDLRQRTENSCDRCKSRKHKCTRLPEQSKCQHCHKYGYDCLVTKPRKHRIYGSVEQHTARMTILEGLVSGLIPEADVSNLDEMRHIGRSLGIPLPDERVTETGARLGTQKDEEQLVHDLQGQSQYIGPGSSFRFHKTLRTLVNKPGGCHVERVVLLGREPAPTEAERASENDQHAAASSGLKTEQEQTLQVDSSTTSLLVRTYFEQVNVDFPVLHEATFLEQLDLWHESPALMDHAWLCILLCVAILARRLCPIPPRDDREGIWWSRIEPLLTKVMYTSSLGSVQALMLAALHLHNTGCRDMCWTLTGAAVRIGFAIGLHRDNCEAVGSPLDREMRKRVWWTLYHFEQLQVSSHDRPSAIGSHKFVSEKTTPRSSILDAGASTPPEYLVWSNRLIRMLGAACRSLRDVAEDGYAGPLSPAAALIRDLTRWRTTLPAHLRVDLIDSMPSPFQRSLILLHVQYHYVVCLITRYALLARFTCVSRGRNHDAADSDTTPSMSGLCTSSGREACRLLLKLDTIAKFNAVTWWDVYYLYSSVLVLILSLICDVCEGTAGSAAETRHLLRQCTDLARRYLEVRGLPETMHRWLDIVVDLESLALAFASRRAEQDGLTRQTSPTARDSDMVAPPPQEAGLMTDSVVLCDAMPETGSLLDSPHCNQGIFDPLSSGFAEGMSPQLGGEGSSMAQHWQATHWEGIGDMLLNANLEDWDAGIFSNI